ncbi:MAG: DUF1648 domain-containing protein [Peptococcaceae bacterium]|nr:DUF1648 domain-containing protein [Peptococcaceae bacterium]
MRYDNKRSAEVISEWPKRLPFSLLDRVLIVFALVAMLLPVVHLLLIYGSLPAEIATEYAGDAVVESEPKWFLFILAFSDVLCTLSVLVCAFFPRAINLPPVLLKRPAEQIIRGTRFVLYITSIACALFFGYMLETFIYTAQGTPMTISGWATAAFVVVVFATIGLFCYWLWRGDAHSAPKGKVQGKEAIARSKVMRKWPERLPFSLLDKVLFGLSVLVVVLTLVRLAMVYGTLPDTIPTHFGLNGEADATGGKSELLVLAGVDLLCWAVIVVFNFFPQFINVPVFLMKRPADEIVRGTRVLMHVTAILCAALFWYMIEVTMQVAVGAAVGLSNAVVFAFIGALIMVCLIYFFWLWRA